MLTNRDPAAWIKAMADFELNEDFEAIFKDNDPEPRCNHGVDLESECDQCDADWEV